MARRIDEPQRQTPNFVGVAVVAVVAIAVLLGGAAIFGASLVPQATPATSGGIAALPSGSPDSWTGVGSAVPTDGRATPTPTVVAPGASPTVPVTAPPTSSPIPTSTSAPGAAPTLPPGGAPRSAAEFDLATEVIDIGFPLRPQTRYRYTNSFLDARQGSPDDYNHARMNRDGDTVRLHDGVDIYGREGSPVLAPFSGLVIDPASRWAPWEPDRYGLVIAIVSDEPQTLGYVALLVHVDEMWVDVGQHVDRGQVLGPLGRTGYLDGPDVHSHLHFELRAPFQLDWSPTGEHRMVDAFNPFYSLARADPKRH